MFTHFWKVWDLQAQIIISYKINRVDDRMLCEVALYGGLLGAKRKKNCLLQMWKILLWHQVMPVSEKGLVT